MLIAVFLLIVNIASFIVLRRRLVDIGVIFPIVLLLNIIVGVGGVDSALIYLSSVFGIKYPPILILLFLIVLLLVLIIVLFLNVSKLRVNEISNIRAISRLEIQNNFGKK
jgi:hypothetical protein